MIFDNIKNCEMYYGVNEKFKKAFEFIKKAVEENFEVGVYEIDGKEIYASVQNYDSKLMETCLFEGHEKYIDIQYIIEGCEVMGVTDISNAVIDVEYSDEKDVAFYKDCETASYCNVDGGAFCVFYPHDIHRPGIAFKNTPSNIRKIVVKVRV